MASYKNNDVITCPKCGKSDDLDGFDVMGADADKLFCTDCHCEFVPDPVQVEDA